MRIIHNPEKQTVFFTLNGSRFVLDTATGAVLSLKRAGCPEFIASPCGLVDLAYPVHLDYDLLRLSPCGKYNRQSPVIRSKDGTVIIRYRMLSMNIAMPDLPEMKGGVEVTIFLSPDPDGRSVDMRCTVTNHSDTLVRQILFPNLEGLAAVSGEQNARFTTTLFHMNPYVEQDSNERSRERFYGENRTVAGQFFSPAGLFPANGADRAMGGRWLDYGSLNAGLSLYRQAWGWGPENKGWMGSNDTYWVKLNHEDRTVRIASMQYLELGNGQTYDSGVYVLTPHEGGWVRGIDAYKAFVKKNQKRVVPVPRCMKEWMGFRTAWLGSGYPKDPEDAAWTYRDLPALADDIAEHGLGGLCLWGWSNSDYFPYTKDTLYPEYGGYDLFRENVKVCREKGVDVYPLVSFVQVWYKQAVERGLPVNATWAETIKAVPVFRAPYMKRWSSCNLGNLDQDWWKDAVNESLRFCRDELGMPSIAWDQYILLAGNDALHELINNYRLETSEMYPEAHFSGESTFFMESDIDNCDTQWTWLWWNEGMTDYRPYLYVVETERPNINVDSSPLFAKYIFMDNAMMNAYPSKPGLMNGSAMISDYPRFSETLKRLAALRKSYLAYFTDGDNLGDCPLCKEPENVRAGFYRQNGTMLGFAVLNERTDRASLSFDLGGYLDADRFDLTVLNEKNEVLSVRTVSKKGTVRVKGEPTDLFVLRFVPVGDK